VIRSLAARLTLLEQITLLVAVAAFGLLALWITTHVVRAERKAFVAEIATRLALGFEEELKQDPDTSAAVKSMLEDAREIGLWAEIRDPSGWVVGSNRPRSAEVPNDEEAFAASATSFHGERVTVTGSDSALPVVTRALGRSLLIAAIPILALSMLFGRAIVSSALRPLQVMAERAANLSLEQNPRSLGARSGLAELDPLAASFDRLLERLDDALKAERRLSADASHELRTPLTVLSGELELLLEAAAPGSPSSPGLTRAVEQVAAMRELVDAIMLLHQTGEIGSAGRAGREVINLCDLARETITDVRERSAARRDDLTHVLPDEVLVSGDGTLLASALRNLLDNALKFTRPGQAVAVSLVETDGRVELTVDDSGAGIPVAERERVFDPFYRGAEARAGGSGFGLGLPILRRVARAHGGDVQVLDSPLGGARLVLRLPGLANGASLNRAS
jgi:signal transduction histidine kinase